MHLFMSVVMLLATVVVALMTTPKRNVNAQVSPLPGFPVETNSGDFGSMQCTKNSNEIYAVCGSFSGIAIKYNLQPFSFAVTGPAGAARMISCDLYETSSQSASRLVCARQTQATISFLQVSDLTQTAFVVAPAAAYYVTVDTTNQAAYVSNYNVPATIYKIISIASSSPSVAGSVVWGENSGDQNPSALLVVGDFLYAHLAMSPARLARISISNFERSQTVRFLTDESSGQYDNLANDNNFIYDVTLDGILVRCTYQNNTFARFDSLSTDFTSTYSLSISPDLKTLFFTAYDQNAVVLVDVTSFTQMQSPGSIIPSVFGRPIVTSIGIFYAFSGNNDQVYGFGNKDQLANATYGGSSKIPCPPGYFCPDPNAAAPTPCGPGRYTPSEGWAFAQICPAGFFCPSDTTISPQNCTTGFYCPQASSSAVPCPAGSFCPHIAASPTPCYSGSYCPQKSTRPIGCSGGTYCPEGSPRPLPCPAGSYCPRGSWAFIACSCGSYCPENSTSPTICQNGRYSSDPAAPCAMCPVNFYCPSPAMCAPKPCPIGTVCPRGSIVWQSWLAPLPDSPINTSSGVFGSMQCTKNSDEIYAVCGSMSGIAIKYNLQPFSFAANGPSGEISMMMSCDLYETSTQPTSRVVCAQQYPPTIFFLQVSNMTQVAQIPVAAAHYVVVDTPNEVAYVSNFQIPSAIYKIVSIASSSPSVAESVSWGENNGDQNPCALLIVGDFLYAQLRMYGGPARLARISISNFSHDQTVQFVGDESGGEYDNLANDYNFIYDLTDGILVRCTYQNNNYARFDSLSTDFTSTYSLSISPDLKTLFFTAKDQNAVFIIDVSSFTQTVSTDPIIEFVMGRPIVLSNGIFYAFSGNNDQVYAFGNCYRPANATYGGPSKIICPAGHFCPDPNAAAPISCGPGRYSPSEGWCSCLTCVEGFFCPSNTTVDPEPCPPGFYCPTTTSSILCPCGSFCPSGSIDPSSCNVGTFNPNNGSTSNASCQACPAGEYCPDSSLCSPVGCPCGTYCSNAGPVNCTAGYYNSDSSFFCSLCPEGLYCPLERTCSPIPCGENHFCPPGSKEPLRTVLSQLPNSPFDIHSGVVGTMQCTKSPDETYAVCGSYGRDTSTVKYNLQPLSFAAARRNDGNFITSCDLFVAASQSASRVVCTLLGVKLVFLGVADMNQTAFTPVGAAYYVVVDTPNQAAYVSNGELPSTIYKIINIASSSPTVAGSVVWGQNNGDQNPSALLIVGDFLYAHLAMGPARLARISIATFEHNQTVSFYPNENSGYYDNLANDNNFIYDLTLYGILIRCTYQNNNFTRFDSLNTKFTSTYSLSISPNLKTLFFAAKDQNAVFLVDVSTFTQTLSTGPIVQHASGRPIVMASGIFYAFSVSNDKIWGFAYCFFDATYGGVSKFACPAGYSCPDPGATSPTSCGSGTYSPSSGFCFCPFCPSGAFCPSASTITPQNCPVGTYNSKEGVSSIAACLQCPLGKICQEGSIVPINCNRSTCDSTRNCTLSTKVLVGVTDAQPYCVVSDYSTCPSPLTCSSIINPNYDVHLQCEAAGCRYSGGSCINRNDCFNLFLPSFVIQPFGLMCIGFAKDVLVLLLIGIFGDIATRRVKQLVVAAKFCMKVWSKEQIKSRMETTVYANDSNCRDETSTKRESFEEYCERIADTLFELPKTEDAKRRKHWKRRLVNAITLSLFRSGLWFELDNGESSYRQQEISPQNEEAEQQVEASKQTLKNDDEEPSAEPRKHVDADEKQVDSNEAVNDQNQSESKRQKQIQQDETNQIEEPQLQESQTITTSEILNVDDEILGETQSKRKLILMQESFRTTSTLQQSVHALITSQAQCVVYFASSRDWKVRAASALNNFPSPLQLFYYISSIIIFVAFTFRAVVLDSNNQNIIDQVSKYTCGNAQTHSQSKTTYLLLGFRFLNSSSTATVILIFIKTLHAIYSSSAERFKQLQLSQRLPILGLQTSKSTQILLVFYFLVVASFALGGVTYGLHIIPSLIVVVAAALLLIVDFLFLKLVHHIVTKRKTNEFAQRDKILRSVATHELPLLGLRDEEEYGGRASMISQSQRSMSTKDDHDRQYQQDSDFDVITADEAFDAAKQSVLNSAPTALPQALLVFLLKEEIPTIILTITFQLCFNYLCLYEFGEAFGVANEWQLPKTEYESRKFDCIWGMFEGDVSGIMSVLSSFVGFL